MSTNDAQEVDVVIIGAGFVGLAAGAALATEPAARGRVRILEKGDCVGHFWRGGHEQLSLHSPYHKLPHDGGLSRRYPMFKTKAEVKDYLARYAAAHGLDESLRFGQTVESLEHAPADDAERPWRVSTEQGGAYRARRVVVATGLNREPHVPAFKGAELYRGDLRHSWRVSSCGAYRDKRVLVVGSGNSAAELAVALHEAGAAAIDLLVDGPRHFVSRTATARLFSLFAPLGLSTDTMVHDLHRCTFGAAAVGTAVEAATAATPRDAAAVEREWCALQAGQDTFIRLLSADLSAHGIARPPPFPGAAHDALARIPVYDVDDVRGPGGSIRDGVIGLIRRGGVRVLRGRIERFTATGVVLGEAAHAAPAVAAGVANEPAAAAGTSARDYDAVILGTGFRHRLLDFVRDAAPGEGARGTSLLRWDTDARGVAEPTPRIDDRSRSTVVDSLYLVGLDQFRSTLSVGPVLGYRGYDVGAEIASELYGTPRRLPYPSLPEDEQGGAKPALSVQRMAGVLAAGVVLGALGSALRGRRARLVDAAAKVARAA